MLLVGTANAQDATDAEKAAAAKKAADAETIDKVTVKGIRSAIENAIETKQESTSIVESVSAEDIGKLPDSSIADSIARLPGLTAQRERGRATQINIRGFAGDFAGTTLNGREQVSTSDNRGVEFDQFPSELLSAVTVYKTPDASLIGQGLSGTVDLQTIKPLAYNEQVVALNYRYDQNEVNGEKANGGRYSFSYIDQFMNDTLGVAIGYAHLDSPTQGSQWENGWGTAGGGEPGAVALFDFENGNKRDGFMATIEYKPTDFYSTTFDVYYSKFEKTELKAGFEAAVAFGATLAPGAQYNSAGNFVSGTYTNLNPIMKDSSNPSTDKLFSMGWNHKFKISDNWSVGADFSVSKVDRQFRFLELYAGLINSPTSAQVSLNPKGYYDFQFATDLGDPSNWRLYDQGNWSGIGGQSQDGYLKDFSVQDSLQAFRLDATRSFDEGFLSSVEFGLNVSNRVKEKSVYEARLCIDDCINGAGNVRDSAPFPAIGVSLPFNFASIPNMAYFNADALFGSYNQILKNADPNIAGKNWTVDETIKTFYVQANIDTDLGEYPLKGNIGFQYVDTKQGTTALSTFTGNPTGSEFSVETSYTDFLPSMNLSLGLPAEQYIRFAAAKQMMRPRMDDLRGSVDVGICNSGCLLNPVPIWSAGGGNPLLEPTRATAYDLSYEKYFGGKGYVSAAYFYKDLSSYIYYSRVPYDFTGYPLPPAAPGVPTSPIGEYNQPINGQGGTLKGLELAVSVPLDLLWEPLEGFGIQASYSDTKSSIEPYGPGSTQPMPGLSKYVSNVTAYYEKHGFSIRYSQRSRSDFRCETRGFGADLSTVDCDAETVQDAQINYSFGSGTFEGLSLYLQFSNISDEPATQSYTVNGEELPKSYFEYGRQTLIGFSYKF
jgi:iron complex outermembrane receptor protein